MPSLRIPNVIDRALRSLGAGGSRRLAGPDVQGPRDWGRGAQPSRPDDNFRPRQPPAPHPPMGGQERPPVKSVAELVPPQLADTSGQEALGRRFASDAALLASHLAPPRLSGSERATRLWEFYAAYATAAAQLPPEPEAREAFREALEGQGFAELRDAHTGEDGVTRGLWVMEARTPAEARLRAAAVRLEPPPEVRHSEEVAARPAEQALAQAPGARAAVLLHGPAMPALRPREEVPQEEAEDARRPRGTNRRLGPRMLWNVLHRFRSDPEDGAVAQGRWERVTFGALLALLGIALAVAALVSL
ncbi:Immediate early protein ICP0 [Myxococcus sp. Y35]|uniref:Immediate early protein ICP0 n=1 Tax=Pseudomyxococcus flavus TaxID=3115648 RepID=UPI003CF59DDF